MFTRGTSSQGQHGVESGGCLSSRESSDPTTLLSSSPHPPGESPCSLPLPLNAELQAFFVIDFFPLLLLLSTCYAARDGHVHASQANSGGGWQYPPALLVLQDVLCAYVHRPTDSSSRQVTYVWFAVSLSYIARWSPFDARARTHTCHYFCFVLPASAFLPVLLLRCGSESRNPHGGGGGGGKGGQ